MGMDENLAQSIFLPFVRSDMSRYSKTGGTGLGLAIVMQIISLHGGNIRLKTSPGNGCVFFIVLPKV